MTSDDNTLLNVSGLTEPLDLLSVESSLYYLHCYEIK